MRNFLFILSFLPLTFTAQTPLSLSGFLFEGVTPSFHHVNTFNSDAEVEVHLPLTILNAGQTVTIYITEDLNNDEWESVSTLTDVRSIGAQSVPVGENIEDNAVVLLGIDELDIANGARPGMGYDLVIDTNNNGLFDEADIVDGINEAGFFLIGNFGENGPYDVVATEHVYSDTIAYELYYPSNISELEAQPFVVISHGWTHNYHQYDHLGEYLATYGYVVISHWNDVGDGGAQATLDASQSALNNMDHFLGHLAEIDGGLLMGKVDAERIIHTGHSTGGECVVRAYKRLFDGDFTSDYFDHEDVICVISLAPVAFHNGGTVHPEGVNYHQFLCGADTDVSGTPIDAYVQALSIYERGYGNKSVTYIHGAGHNDLNNSSGSSWGQGPNMIGRPATHSILLPYFLSLSELYSHSNLAMKEFLTRNASVFRPQGVDTALVVSNEYRESLGLITDIDHYQENSSLDVASSGAAVSSTGMERHEVLMRDFDESFDWTGDQWSNGMCRSRYDDDPYCTVFSWEEAAALTYSFEEAQDWTLADQLNFRMCQLTRHPLNQDVIDFAVTLTDLAGESATLSIAGLGAVEPNYPKGNGGYLEACLEEGIYTIEVGGSTWPEEMLFVIPGYFDEEQIAGTYELEIGAGDPCTDIEVFMYDTWGDGWDQGSLQIFNEDDELVTSGTLFDGFEPDSLVGWQNEFRGYVIDLNDFLALNPSVDLSMISSLDFAFGGNGFSQTGALGLDDIYLSEHGLSFGVSLPEEKLVNEIQVFPIPATHQLNIWCGSSQLRQFRIFNLQGELVWNSMSKSPSVEVDLNDLRSGVYVLHVEEGSRSMVKKIVVR